MVSTVVIRFCQSRRKLHILRSSLEGEGLLGGANDESADFHESLYSTLL